MVHIGILILCPSTQKPDENSLAQSTGNSQRQRNPFSPKVELQRRKTSLHHLTPIGSGDKYFLARLMSLFDVQWDISNKQVPQLAVIR